MSYVPGPILGSLTVLVELLGRGKDTRYALKRQVGYDGVGMNRAPSVYPVTSTGPGSQQVLSMGQMGEREKGKMKGAGGRFFFY